MRYAKPLVILIFAVTLSTLVHGQLGAAAGGFADAQQRELERQHQLQTQREADETALELARIQAQSQAAQTTQPSSSGPFYWESGNAFLAACQNSLEKFAQTSSLTDAEISAVSECASFLRGFNEGVNLGVQLSEASAKIKLSQPWCTPPTATDVQLGLVLVKYIRAHPETAHERTTFLATVAFREAFACQGK